MKACKFKFGLGSVDVYGGPYMERPDEAFGVKMAVEINRPCDVDVPTRDFDVPKEADLEAGVAAALEALGRKEAVYVGCMGGIGRTGLFLAVLAKALGIEDPVRYVRKQYMSHAVETKQQKEYVEAFDVSRLKLIASDAKWSRARRVFKRQRKLNI